MPTTPGTRHYLYWIAACSCTPLACAWASWLTFDPDPLPGLMPAAGIKALLGFILLIAGCLSVPVLQMQAIRGALKGPPSSPGNRQPLWWLLWPLLVLALVLLHLALIVAFILKGAPFAWLGGREFAAFALDTEYFRTLVPGPAQNILPALPCSAALHTLCLTFLPAVFLGTRLFLPWQDILLCSIAGDLAEIAADCLLVACGACHYSHYSAMLIEPSAYDLFPTLTSRAAAAALGGAVSCRLFERIVRRLPGSDTNEMEASPAPVMPRLLAATATLFLLLLALPRLLGHPMLC